MISTVVVKQKKKDLYSLSSEQKQVTCDYCEAKSPNVMMK